MRFFKKRQPTDYEKIMYELDWFRRASWFSSYFWEKVKNMILNFIYSLYTSLDSHKEKFLKQYFIEIQFYTPKSRSIIQFNKKNKTTHDGDYLCVLPLIAKVRNIEEAHFIVAEINRSLVECGCSVFDSGVHKEFVTEAMLDEYLRQCENKLKTVQIGTINLETRTPMPVPENEESDEGRDYGIPATKYDRRLSKFKFGIIKVNSSTSLEDFEYPVLIEKTESIK